jgi:hypothetical protein
MGDVAAEMLIACGDKLLHWSPAGGFEMLNDSPSSNRIVAIHTDSRFDRVAVSDDVGNVFSISRERLMSILQDSIKRSSQEVQKMARQETKWEMALTSQAPHVDAYGCSGWCGLEPLAHDDHRFISVRENFNDLRLLDLRHSGEVPVRWVTSHSPVSVDVSNAGTVAICGGPQVSCYDVRQQEPVTRFTLPNGTPCCSICCRLRGEYEVAVGTAERQVLICDSRTWRRLRTLQNVLKHAVYGITSLVHDSVVCRGTVCEVRTVPLAADADLNAGGANCDAPTVSSFRTRIDSTVTCHGSWHGQWAAATSRDAAIGMSTTFDPFVVTAVPA